MTNEKPATMNVNGKAIRCTVLEAYGQSDLNYRVRFDEDCALGKTGKVYIAPRRLLTFGKRSPDASDGA